MVIEGRLPAHNAYLGACMYRRHYAMRLKEEWDERVAWEARAQHVPRPGSWPVAVFITVYEPDARRDWDGSLGFAMKTVLDGLQIAGVLPDDDLEHVRPVIPWVSFDRDRPRVEVEIVEGEEAWRRRIAERLTSSS